MRTLRSLIRPLQVGGVLAIMVVLTGANQAPRYTDARIVIDAAPSAGGSGRRISPEIYGVAGATPEQLAVLNVGLVRHGGNATSRYNWKANASNRASDWYFESVSEPGTAPGASVDAFIRQAKAVGAVPTITVPMLDWVAGLGPGRSPLASYSIRKYGPQTGSDMQWFPDAGNGIRPNGTPITTNDPRDAHVPAGPAFQQEWIRHLVATWGPSSHGGQGGQGSQGGQSSVRYFILDNEPSLWSVTHRDVVRQGTTMDDVSARLVATSDAIKAVDPTAKVIAPEEWGWAGYLYSGADQEFGRTHGWWRRLPDRAAHGGLDYLPWLLTQWRQRERATGRRVVDVVSVHYYPQGGEFSNDISSAMQRLRNRSTRSLWDSGYTDESWIQARVQLIPRLRRWVDRYGTPGTPIAITEYNWGADGHISGALAQADLLGIFGREGLDMAARWGTPADWTPTFKAMQMYRNYDGRRSTFGDVSLPATGPNPDQVAVFAARRDVDRAITVIVINKEVVDAPMTIMVMGIDGPAPIETWRLDASNAITRQPDAMLTRSQVRLPLPAQSITLLVIQPG